MAISRARKEELVAQYVDLMDRSSALFLAEYRGMSVKQVEELRGKVREVDGAVYVAKNTLIRVALEQTGNPVPADMLSGQTAIGFALGEAPSMAKALSDYAKAEELFVLRGGVMNESVMSSDDVKALADLPSIDQLRAQLIGIIQGPARGIVSAVTSGVRQVVNVLDAYAKKDESEAAEAAA